MNEESESEEIDSLKQILSKVEFGDNYISELLKYSPLNKFRIEKLNVKMLERHYSKAI